MKQIKSPPSDIQDSNDIYLLTSSTYRDPMINYTIDKINFEASPKHNDNGYQDQHYFSQQQQQQQPATQRKSITKHRKNSTTLQFIKNIATSSSSNGPNGLGLQIKYINNGNRQEIKDNGHDNKPKKNEVVEQKQTTANMFVYSHRSNNHHKTSSAILQNLNNTYLLDSQYQGRMNSSPSPINHEISPMHMNHEDCDYTYDKLCNSNSIGRLGVNSPQKQSNTELSSSRAYINAMRALQEKIKILEERLVHAKNESLHAHSEYATIHDELMHSTNELNRIRDELAHVNNQLKHANDDLSHSKSELRHIKDELKHNKEELECTKHEKKHELNEMKERMGLIDKKTYEMKAMIERLERERDEILKENKDSENKIKKLENELMNMTNEKNNLEKTICVLENRYSELITTIDKIKVEDNDIKMNNAKIINDIKDDNEKLKLANNELKNKLYTTETEYEEYKRIYNEHINELILKNQNLTKDLDNLKLYYNKQMKEFQNELDLIDQTHQNKIGELQEYIRAIKEKYSCLQQAYQKQNVHIQMLKNLLHQNLKTALHINPDDIPRSLRKLNPNPIQHTSSISMPNINTILNKQYKQDQSSPIVTTSIIPSYRNNMTSRAEYRFNIHKSLDSIFDPKILQASIDDIMNRVGSIPSLELNNFEKLNNSIQRSLDIPTNHNNNNNHNNHNHNHNNSISIFDITPSPPSFLLNKHTKSMDKTSSSSLITTTGLINEDLLGKKNNMSFNQKDNLNIIRKTSLCENKGKEVNNEIDKYLYSTSHQEPILSPMTEHPKTFQNPLPSTTTTRISSSQGISNTNTTATTTILNNLKSIENSHNALLNDLDPLLGHLTTTFNDNNNNNNMVLKKNLTFGREEISGENIDHLLGNYENLANNKE